MSGFPSPEPKVSWHLIGSSCSSGQCEPRPETILRLAHRALASPGLALIAIQELRKLCPRRRIGLRVAGTRDQPTQLYPMQQPVGARQAAINLKLLFQYSLRVNPTKRHHPVPLQLGAGDNPLLEPRARHRVDPGLPTRARPVTQSLNAILLIAVMPFVSRRPAQPSRARLPHAPSPPACSRSSQPAGTHARSRGAPSAAARPPPVRCEKSVLASSIPQTWYTSLITLPYLGISRYQKPARRK